MPRCRPGSRRAAVAAKILLTAVVAVSILLIVVPLTAITRPGSRSTWSGPTHAACAAIASVVVARLVTAAPGSRSSGGSTLPWLGVSVRGPRAGLDARRGRAATDLCHELLEVQLVSVSVEAVRSG